MTREEYTNVLDANGVERQKCKYCGEDIFYPNTEVRIGLRSRNVHIGGTSYLTHRNILGKVYNLCVCNECKEKFANEHGTGHSYNVLSRTTQFAFNIDEETFIAARKYYYGSSLEHKIRKYGEEEGKKQWENYRKKQSETNTFEYKHRVYGMTEKEFKEYNKSRAATKKNMIRRWGEEEGLKRWNSYVEKQKLTKSWNYMVETYGIEKARQINASKVNSLENYKRKYGDEEGTKRWNEYVLKYRSGYSQMSQTFFRKLDKILGKKYTTFYAAKNYEYPVIGPNNSYVYKLDYFIKELNLCIEFNGGCFHGDPRIYEDDYFCNPWNNLTAKQIREKDQERYKTLKQNHNIDTLVVWELDYNNGIDIKNFISETLKIKL